MAEDSALRLATKAASPADIGAAAARAVVARGVTGDENRAVEVAVEAAENEAPAGPVETPASPLSLLVKYVPSETLTIYVAFQGALGDIEAPEGSAIDKADFGSRWIVLGAVLALTMLMMYGLSYRSQKDGGAKKTKFPLFEVAAGSAAFLVWALSLPSTPLRDFAGFDYSAWNSLILLVGTVVIAMAAHVFGATVAWKKVVNVEN